jgi:hypothetical protein
LWLCGTVVVDTGRNPGICLYIFSGASDTQVLQPSAEGQAEWVEFEMLESLPVVEDLPVLLRRIHKMRRGDPPFSARSFYDKHQRLVVTFG